MGLDNDLIAQFAKYTKFETKDKVTTTVRGTIHVSEGCNYIHLDGADENSNTPVETTVEVNEGDRVIAISKDHSIIVTGNETNPSVGTVTAGILSSTIEQTEASIRTTVEANYGSLSGRIDEEVSTITQRANEIATRVEHIEGDNVEFSEFKQTVEGFSFMGTEGGVKISHGDINLTGAITWNDFNSSTKSTINGVADSAYKLASEAMEKADAVKLPSYIKSTYIDSTIIESPNIVGGIFHAVGADPDLASTFTTMDENGFYLYSNASEADMDNTIYPKISLYCDNDAALVEPMVILGSGQSDDSQFHNRFIIRKHGLYASMRYNMEWGPDPGSGITFGSDGIVTIEGELRGSDNILTIDGELRGSGNILTVEGELRGSTGLFPIGYIYWSFSRTSPASLFGGTWEQLEAVFPYATGDLSGIGTTGTMVIDHLYAEGISRGYFVKVAAWRRIG